jgi:acyl carrier protein
LTVPTAMDPTSMDRAAILDGVSRVFAEHLSMNEITESTHLFRDLELDSLQQLTLVVEIENRFRIRFDEGDESGIETVCDLVDLVASRLAAS